MKEKPQYWLSPVPPACDLCWGKFDCVMYDARTSGGPWGNICYDCFIHEGCELGVGKGQRYTLVPDGRWLKTGG